MPNSMLLMNRININAMTEPVASPAMSNLSPLAKTILKILHGVAPMVRTETRHFGRDEEDKAWEWLEAKPAEA